MAWYPALRLALRAPRRYPQWLYRLVKKALQEKCISYSGTATIIREYIYATNAAKLSVKVLVPEYANRPIWY